MCLKLNDHVIKIHAKVYSRKEITSNYKLAQVYPREVIQDVVSLPQPNY
jgi:hypothetical protein